MASTIQMRVRPPRTRGAALLAVLLCVVALVSSSPAMAVGTTTTDSAVPAPASTAAVQAVPGDLWDVAPRPGTGATYVIIQGERGEPITGGGTFEYSKGDAVITVLGETGVRVRVNGDEMWDGSFAPPPGTGRLQVGYHPFTYDVGTTPAGATMSWSGRGVGCSDATGWFAIDEITWVDGAVATLTARFAQTCHGTGPTLHGKVGWDVNDPSAPGGPQAIPPGTWDVDPGVVGSYVYLQGAPGGWPMNGTSRLYTPADAAIEVTEYPGGLLHVRVDPPDSSESSSADFRTMLGVDEIRPGLYADVHRYPFHNPAKGGLDWNWASHGCNALDGWFAVDSVRHDATGALTHLTLRFGQRCTGYPPMVGKVVLLPDSPWLDAGPPIGNLDLVDPAPGGLRLRGWSLDPEVATPITVHLTVDGAVLPVLADRSRPDVERAYPGYGAAHGYDAVVGATPGRHRVCAHGIDPAGGPNAVLACRDVVVGSPPIGALDAVDAASARVDVRGWAIDPDTAAPIDVHVYVDGRAVALRADGDRPDVGAAFPGYGARHGYSASIGATPGPHRVCAWGINAVDAPGVGNRLLGCRDVVVGTGSPFGSLDEVAAVPGGVRVRGWAADPDLSGPVEVVLYVDGASIAVTAGDDRPDVGAVFPGIGPAHGFDAHLGATAGAHRVCAFALDVGVGENTLLGCRTVAVG